MSPTNNGTDGNKADLKTIAMLLDLDERRVQQLAKEGIVKKGSRGEYEMVPSIRGYIRYLRTQATGNAGDIQQHKTRIMKGKADLIEAAAKERCGELINRSWALAAWGEAVQMMKTHFLGLPSKLVQRIRAAETDAEARQIFEAGIKKALSAVACVEIKSLDFDDTSG